MNWFKEKALPDYAQTFEIEEVCFSGTTKYQKIDIVRSNRFGKVLILDDIVQTTEADEFIYHEMFAHIPLNAYGDARSVLIVGGGDGGLLEEVLKHDSIKKVTVVEIDEEVVNACKRFLPRIHNKAFDDPRTQLVFEDAAKWVAESNDKFDVVLVDRSDFLGPNASLYERDFYKNCSKLMSDEGIFVVQSGVLAFNTDYIPKQLLFMSQAWKKNSFYLVTIPTYAGGQTVFAWGANWNITNIDDVQLQATIDSSHVTGLKYYNVNTHKAAFALPTFAREL